MGKFENCLLASDIDGTLMENGYINPKNLEKIEYFMREGGYFSLCTGRSVGAISSVLSSFKSLSPCVVANGCMIYDYQKEMILYQEIVPFKDYEIVRDICDFPLDVGIEVHTGNRVLTVRRSAETDAHQIYESLETTTVTFEETLKYDWNKVLYTSDSLETREKLKAYVLSRFGDCGCDFVETIVYVEGVPRYYFEQLPKAVSKASAIIKLAELLGIEKGSVYTIGDYYNDLEMIKLADIGAATSDAPEDVRKYADYVTCDCQSGAVADFIDFLSYKRDK